MANIDTDVQAFTPTELLNLCEKGIAQLIVGGQSYTIPGVRTFTRGQLSELKALRSDLKQEVEAANSTTGTLRALVKFGGAQ